MKTLKGLFVSLCLVMPVVALSAPAAKLYKNPHCACCDEYADYLRENGMTVKMINTADMEQVKKQYRVPEHLYGCHTLLLGGYVFEGLIPVDSIQNVLEEKPSIVGLSLPGMPRGAPGMPGIKRAPLLVYTFGQDTDSSTPVYATYDD